MPIPNPRRRREEAVEVPGQDGVMLGWYPGEGRGDARGGPHRRPGQAVLEPGKVFVVWPPDVLPSPQIWWLLPPSWWWGELKIYILKYLKKTKKQNKKKQQTTKNLPALLSSFTAQAPEAASVHHASHTQQVPLRAQHQEGSDALSLLSAASLTHSSRGNVHVRLQGGLRSAVVPDWGLEDEERRHRWGTPKGF